MFCLQKPDSDNTDLGTTTLTMAHRNEDLLSAISSGECQVAGATSFLWSREDAFETLDVLFVDEAAQMSLANVLAVSQAAPRLILLGDPQQLDQPTRGTNPDGVGVSALEHVLAGRQTIVTIRASSYPKPGGCTPDVCTFCSELFYEGKLQPVESCARQTLISSHPVSGFGLRSFPVAHTGNTSSSIEEADAVAGLVASILATDASWIGRPGESKQLAQDDILIITSYNAQVLELQKRLPGARIGTVDKFQGQEAPISIYSMATSSHADAPRGMDFLYSGNRLNVANSRAKCLAILVASPSLVDAECKTPKQMQLANAFCRYLEPQ